MLEFITYISGLLVIIATTILAFQNRESSDVLKAASVIVGGVTVSLITMFLFFRDEELAVRFATTVIHERETGIPIRMPYLSDTLLALFPDSKELLERQLETSTSFREAAAFEAGLGRQFFSEETKSPIREYLGLFYSDLVTLQVVRAISRQFASGWSPDFEPAVYNVLGSSNNVLVGGTPSVPSSEAPTKLDGADVRKFLEDNAFRSVADIGLMLLPPKSSFIVERYPLSRRLIIENAFVRIEIDIDSGISLEIVNDNKVLQNLRLAAPGGYSASLIPINVRQRFKGVKRGHPLMELHRRWAQRLVTTIRAAFDDSAFWTKLESITPDSLPIEQSLNTASPKISAPIDLLDRVGDYRVLISFDKNQLNPALEEIGDIILRLSQLGLRLDTETTDLLAEPEVVRRIQELTDRGRLMILTLVPALEQQAETILEELVISAFQERLPNYVSGPTYKRMTFKEIAASLPDSELKADFLSADEKLILIVIIDRTRESP